MKKIIETIEKYCLWILSALCLTLAGIYLCLSIYNYAIAFGISAIVFCPYFKFPNWFKFIFALVLTVWS